MYVTAAIRENSQIVGVAAELLTENDLADAERSRFTTNVAAQSERLQALIDKLLRLAQLEQQRELDAPAMLKLSDLFAELEQAMSAQAAQRKIALHFEAGPDIQLNGDRFLLGLALTNLLQTALDFSPSGSAIQSSAEADATRVTIHVRDQGRGLADFAQERIFERFFSLPRPDGGPKSTGLCLSLVREMAMLHGGEIRLDSLPQGCAVATLSIPLAIEGKRNTRD